MLYQVSTKDVVAKCGNGNTLNYFSLSRNDGNEFSEEEYKEITGMLAIVSQYVFDKK